MITQLPKSLHKAVTRYAGTHVLSIPLPSHSIPFTENTIPLLISNKHLFGLTVFTDATKSLSFSLFIPSSWFASIPVIYHHTDIPGMILMDSATPSPTPVQQTTRKTQSLPRLSLDIDGIEFSCLFYLPQKSEFLFLLQLSSSVKEPRKALSMVLETVHAWIIQFSSLYRQVCVETLIEFQLYSWKYTDLAYLDTTLNHIPDDMFRDRVAPLMVFFKSKSMFMRLKKLIMNTYKVGMEEEG